MARFNVYGRYEIDVERQGERWVAYRRGEGKRQEDPSISIPSHITEDDLRRYLEDLLHEEASQGTTIQRIR